MNLKKEQCIRHHEDNLTTRDIRSFVLTYWIAPTWTFFASLSLEDLFGWNSVISRCPTTNLLKNRKSSRELEADRIIQHQHQQLHLTFRLETTNTFFVSLSNIIFACPELLLHMDSLVGLSCHNVSKTEIEAGYDLQSLTTSCGIDEVPWLLLVWAKSLPFSELVPTWKTARSTNWTSMVGVGRKCGEDCHWSLIEK